jgi:hypothetical protein
VSTRRRLAALALAASVVAALVAGCSGRDEDAASTTTVATTTVLRAADFPDAVAAVEAERGPGQRYVEINATPEGVNVFVAVDETNEVSYYFTDGALQPAGDPAPQTSKPFSVEGLDLSLGERLVLDVQQRFPGATVVSVALLELPEGLRWALRSRSAQGGLLNVLFTPAGELSSVAPA